MDPCQGGQVSIITGLSNGAYAQEDLSTFAILITLSVISLCIGLILMQRARLASDLDRERDRDELVKEELWDRLTNATFEEMEEIDQDLAFFCSPSDDSDLFDHRHQKYVALIQGATG